MTDVNIQRLMGLSVDQRAVSTKRPAAGLFPDLEKSQPIIDAVRDEGDAVLVRLGRELDCRQPAPFGQHQGERQCKVS